MAEDTGKRFLRRGRGEPALPRDSARSTALGPRRPAIMLWGNESPALAERLLSFRIDTALDRPARCEASFAGGAPAAGDPTGSPLDRRLLDFGKELAIAVGGETLFRGRIDALGAEYPATGRPEVRLRAADGLEELRQAVRSRTFTDVTDVDAIEAVAREYALPVRLEGVEQGPPRRSLVQLEQSDLEFVAERAHALDASLQLDGWTLVLRARSQAAGTERLVLGSDLLSFSVLADLEPQRTRVDVGAWDVRSAVPADATAGEEVVRGELQGASGAAVLRAALGERTGVAGGARTLLPGEARERAVAAFRNRARTFVGGRGVTAGTPALRPGHDVELDGLGAPFDGRYRVTRVVHRFDGAEGLRSEFEAARPGLGEPA